MLVTGSLGSGKTTLLKRILDNAPFRIAVLMNEFGEIAIDSTVIKGEYVDIVELVGGCACCSLTGEFESAVREIIAKSEPELIVVEATGVAESDALVYEIEDNLPGVRLDSVVGIIDAYLGVRHPHVGYTSRVQIASADILLINKTDLVSDKEVKGIEAQARGFNDRAVIVRTVNCGVDTGLLFGLGVGTRPRVSSTTEPERFESFWWESDKMLDLKRFADLAKRLPESVFRAKGFIHSREGGRLFNYVSGRSDVEDFPAETNRIVFIGRNLEEHREHILEQLRRCEEE